MEKKSPNIKMNDFSYNHDDDDDESRYDKRNKLLMKDLSKDKSSENEDSESSR